MRKKRKKLEKKRISKGKYNFMTEEKKKRYRGNRNQNSMNSF